MSKEHIEQLKKILNAMADFWSDVPEKRGRFYVEPHPQPDFPNLQACIDSIKWTYIEDEHQQRVENIREAVQALRDSFHFSDMLMYFDPLRGHGYKYDASSGRVEFHRYRKAQDYIDLCGMEVERAIKELEGMPVDA